MEKSPALKLRAGKYLKTENNSWASEMMELWFIAFKMIVNVVKKII